MNYKNNLFKNVKLLILDVDGVLTRGEIIYDDKGREFKVFNVQDGLGVSLLGKAGIKTILLTARDSAVVHRRAKDMRVSEVIAGVLPKESVLASICAKYKVKPKDICFVGDDLIDVGLMERIGVPATVSDAPKAVKKYASYVTKRGGGKGAVREIIELIWQAQHLEDRILKIVKNLAK
ncbi:MAG: HAD-IIIA family hydrolase [Candidatus Omnitrophica bacterium]|nr:HAD-IIIA family hydrolase [Candidatus Omnitrophota bacterium]